MNNYICKECGTNYYTPEDKAPPTPNWDDGHVCRPQLIIECCLCDKSVLDRESHNAEPIVEKGRCCLECNEKVIAARLARVMGASIKFNNKKR